jgi:hypothetical protein
MLYLASTNLSLEKTTGQGIFENSSAYFFQVQSVTTVFFFALPVSSKKIVLQDITVGTMLCHMKYSFAE